MKSNYSLDDMRCFCVVARLGSFKQAAQALDMPLSTLSRRIQKLEQDLSLRLFHRDAHKVLLTNTGRRYYERTEALFAELNDIAEDLHADKHEAKGIIRIAAPINIGSQILGDKLNLFLQQYPNIQLDLKLSNSITDIDEQAIDVAFRMGVPAVDDWIARPLWNIRFVVCAGPDRQEWHTISHPALLENYPIILCHPLRLWELENHITGENIQYQPGQNLRLNVDEFTVTIGAVRTGIGIGLIPDYYASTLIERGEVVRILPEWSSHPRTLHMLYRDRDNLPHRVRLLISFMLEQFKSVT
ncbi:LysR family transcriptional regulator [Vibrio mangrovi]|uniref:HTH-type transcriptional regulator DmlR n=1 Tax=Vibrio mangrovi TaxID=474394 RepID=A0A1Y6ISA0_9VIBR|nr:LysR family transcriptional regulator [Vibrio mangrovi]MDW6001429.1 LysR family transcriptional regulator [Vibrio mangrovi]SMS00549.1 HTH-type transcriptional regulator DmlR [Vibrio mangrovi]